MASWFLCHLQLGWEEGWELVGLLTLLPNTQRAPLCQVWGRRQPRGWGVQGGLMGWRGVLGLSCLSKLDKEADCHSIPFPGAAPKAS